MDAQLNNQIEMQNKIINIVINHRIKKIFWC